MCGIAGVVSPRAGSDLREVVKRMAAELSHRGPDDQGDWVDMSCGVALAHRRLSIIDVTTQGHQPMHSASGRFVVVYNGEIYNFEEDEENLKQLILRQPGEAIQIPKFCWRLSRHGGSTRRSRASLECLQSLCGTAKRSRYLLLGTALGRSRFTLGTHPWDLCSPLS